MLLSNIMEKGGAGQVSASRCQQTHLVSRVEGVPPIGSRLPEEKAVLDTAVEQRFDEGSLRIGEASCRRNLDEPSEEVPPRTEFPALHQACSHSAIAGLAVHTADRGGAELHPVRTDLLAARGANAVGTSI